MPEQFSKELRSEIMRKVKSTKNLSTELRMVEILKINHITGWRRNYKVFGKPDFTFPGKKIALFIDGCFWHGHNCRNLKPVQNKEYWQQKIERNMARDNLVTGILEKRGWFVYRLWECELSKKSNSPRLKQFIEKMQAFHENSKTPP